MKRVHVSSVTTANNSVEIEREMGNEQSVPGESEDNKAEEFVHEDYLRQGKPKPGKAIKLQKVKIKDLSEDNNIEIDNEKDSGTESGSECIESPRATQVKDENAPESNELQVKSVEEVKAKEQNSENSKKEKETDINTFNGDEASLPDESPEESKDQDSTEKDLINITVSQAVLDQVLEAATIENDSKISNSEMQNSSSDSDVSIIDVELAETISKAMLNLVMEAATEPKEEEVGSTATPASIEEGKLHLYYIDTQLKPLTNSYQQ